MRRKVAAGNWKMNGLKSALAELDALKNVDQSANCDTIICPPITLLTEAVRRTQGSNIKIGAQNCHANISGAHTGDISAEMIADCGASYVIVGHSERRADHGETNSDVATKAEAAWRANLTAIICVGETEAERDAGETLDVIEEQLDGSTPSEANAENTIIAYEPVWAIGTGRTPTLDEVGEVHDFMREKLIAKLGPDSGNVIRLLYGGSVNPKNATDIFAISNVDGGLVGGASLKAADFAEIIKAAN